MDFAVFLQRLGRNLRTARWRAKLTQQDVAARGVTYRWYQEIEQGRRNPSVKMLFDLAGILDVRVADLLDVGESKPPVRLRQLRPEAPPRGRKPARVTKVRS